MKTPEDIQRVADSDPVMAELLTLRALFFYKDWQLFRQHEPEALIARLTKRVNRVSIVMMMLVIVYAVLLVIGLMLGTGSQSTLDWVLRSALLLLYGFLAVHSLRSRKKLLAIQTRRLAGEFPAE